jgi:hypothetical protein
MSRINIDSDDGLTGTTPLSVVLWRGSVKGAGMVDVRMRCAAAMAAVTFGCLVAGCSSGTGDAASGEATTAEVTGVTVYEPGDSGMFVIEPVPEGWGVDRAYTQDSGSGVYYAKGGDDDITFSILTFDVDPADPQVVQARQALENGDNGTAVVVDGHDAYQMPLTDDGRTYGEQVQWFARHDLVVAVQAPWESELDVVALAEGVHEISLPARDTLVVATSGGGEAAPPVKVMRGTVDGEEWVLNAILPVDYPLQPIDERRGCAVLSFRGETATTCEDRFSTLNDATQVIIGGVNFGFGVVGDGSGEVQLLQPESGSPSQPSDSTVLPAAPDLTWFVATFADVCDRFGLAANGESVIVGVPPGYPHRNDCTS